MLANNKGIQERWNDIDLMVSGWLQERQELIMLMCAINGLKEYTPQSTPVSIKIQAFCQVLMDYVSAGHFEIYDELIHEAEEFNDDGIEVAKRLYPKLQLSTDAALDFNDDYDTEEHCQDLLGVLPQKLSYLSEKLEARFSIEDTLIKVLHEQHKTAVA